MTRHFATIAASLLALLVSGCVTTTSGQADAVQKTSAVPANLGTAAPKLPNSPQRITAIPAPANLPAVSTTSQLPTAGAIAQVGCFRDACGCRDCGPCNTCPTPAPRGYAECSVEGWNLYGVDPQEFLCDGGDHPPTAHLLKNDTVAGLQGEDTVVHYTTEGGDILFQPSNRVCLYAPRFASVRKITAAIAGEKTIGLANVDRPTQINRIGMNQGGLVVRESNGPERAEVAKRIDALRDRNRGVRIENVLEPWTAEKVLPALAALSALELDELREDQLALVQRAANAAIAWSIGESVEVAVEDLKPPTLTRDQKLEAFTIYEFPDAGRLRILKMADRADAPSGELVTFSIRVENVGDSAVSQVVLNDNLVTRLEYVEDSQSCTREAEFEAVANSEQSVRLEWTLKEPLKVGESATVEFKCRVR